MFFRSGPQKRDGRLSDEPEVNYTSQENIMRKKRNYLPGFKVKVVLAAIMEDRALAVHILEQADTVFGSHQEHKSDDAAQLKDLHVRIGERALEDDYLSQALGC